MTNDGASVLLIMPESTVLPKQSRMRAEVDALAVSARRFRPPRVSRAATTTVATMARPSLAADMKELLKPGITLFVVATAAAGYLFGSPLGVQTIPLLGLLIGTGLTAGGSGVLNHLIEARLDRLMRRTLRRPVAARRLSRGFALIYGLVVIAAGLWVLHVFTNPLTTLLAATTSILYVGVYTPLKRRTTLNTFVGAIPGALPALGGFAAATGSLALGGWIAFGIIFLWQLPHFFALAWMYRDDYARGGFVMLPVTQPDGRLTSQVGLGATLLLLLVGVLPSVFNLAGWLYFAGMLAVGTGFTIPAFAFASEPTDLRARRLLVASIVYVPAFFALVVIDYLVC